MRKILAYFTFIIVLASLLTIEYSCNSTSVDPNSFEKLTISGRITFTDTAGYYKFTDTSKGYYNISAFSQWPPMGPATANSRLYMRMEGGRMISDFKIWLPAEGIFTVTSAYIRTPYTSGSVYGLGKYGSDTTKNPAVIFDTTNARVSVFGNDGAGNINFISWIDTTNKIYKF